MLFSKEIGTSGMMNFLQIVSRRRWVVIGVLIIAALISPLIIKLTRPTYQSTAQILVIGNGTTSDTVLPISDISELAVSTNVMQRAQKVLNYPGNVQDLRSMLSVRGSPRSNIITVSVSAKDQSFSTDLANAVADSTVDGYKDLSGQQYAQVVDSLHSQLNSQQQLIHSFDSALASIARHDVVAASTNSIETISTRLSSLEEQRITAKASLTADAAAAGSVGAGSGGGASDKAIRSVMNEQALANDPYYQKLRDGQATDAAAYQIQRAQYTKNYPGLAGLAVKVRNEKLAVDHAANSAIRNHSGASATYAEILLQRRSSAALVAGDTARLTAIETEINNTQHLLETLPKAGASANELRLQRDSASAAYEQLEARLQMTLADQQKAASLSSIVVLNHANSGAEKMARSKILSILTLIVLALAIAAAFLAERLDPRMRGRTQIEELYGFPLLGTVG